MNKHIDKVVETSDVDKLNDLLSKKYILIGSYVDREWVNDTCYEKLTYSVGRLNTDRFLEEEIMGDV